MSYKNRGFVNCEYKNGVKVHIKDRELTEKILYYGRRKDMNCTDVIIKLIKCKDNIDGLIDDLDREAYELLDEDQKIDVILQMQRKIKELEDKNNA